MRKPNSDYLKSISGKNRNWPPYSLLIIYYLLMLVLSVVTDGTGDDGDSVSHFLFSKYAFTHPENFINHWAKPVYVLLSAPFAQFGFIGIKIFNISVTTLAIFFAYQITRQLRIPNGWFVIIALCCAPMYIRLSPSGLTEPLFALSLTIVIFLALRQKLFYSALLASFIPFIRSEGLIILCIYTFFLFAKRRYALIAVLAVGHGLYSMIGWFYYKDFLWVFNKMSYAVWNSSYGSGSPLNFVYGMKDFIGIPLTVLFCAGTLLGIVWVLRAFSLRERNLSSEELWLIYGGYFSVWISHMIFWSFGLFNSLGLVRVLIAVIPCAAIICLRGFNVVVEWRMITSRPLIKAIIVMIIVAFVFIYPYYELNFKCAFDLSGNQKAILKASEKYRERLKGYTIYSAASYSAVAFGYDIFDSTQYRWLREIHQEKKIPDRSAIVWDDFYTNEARTALSNLMIDQRFELLDTFQSKDCFGYSNMSAVFLYKGESLIEWIVRDTVFKNDFESENFSGRESDLSFLGKYSSAVDETNAFSPGFSRKVSELGFSLPTRIRIGAMFYARQIPFDAGKHALFVASLDHNGTVYFWQGLDIDNVLLYGSTWRNVSFNIEIPEPKDASDVLSIYVWNPHKTVKYVDDFLILTLEQR